MDSSTDNENKTQINDIIEEVKVNPDPDPDPNKVNIEIVVMNTSLDFYGGDGTKLIEHAIRSKYNMKGGALFKNNEIYLGSTLFIPGIYKFVGGKICSSPGMGWASKGKCPCCT